MPLILRIILLLLCVVKAVTATYTTQTVTSSAHSLAPRLTEEQIGWLEENTDYRISGNHEAIIGHGSFGTVYKAFDERSKHHVALKVVSAEDAEDGRSRDIAADYNDDAIPLEVKAITNLLCPGGEGAVRLEHHFSIPAGGLYCLVFELLSCNLHQLLEKVNQLHPVHNLRDGEQQLETQIARREMIKDIVNDILPVISNLHQKGFIHGDIKLSNILFDENQSIFKLSDFGSVTKSGRYNKLSGTWTYMSPEIHAYGEYHPAADMWALGCTLLNAYLGKEVFGDARVANIRGGDGGAHRRSNPDLLLPAEWIEWLGQMPYEIRGRLLVNGYVVPDEEPPWPRLWTELSNDLELFSLISDLLEYNPDKRMTAADMATNEFLKD